MLPSTEMRAPLTSSFGPRLFLKFWQLNKRGPKLLVRGGARMFQLREAFRCCFRSSYLQVKSKSVRAFTDRGLWAQWTDSCCYIGPERRQSVNIEPYLLTHDFTKNWYFTLNLPLFACKCPQEAINICSKSSRSELCHEKFPTATLEKFLLPRQ